MTLSVHEIQGFVRRGSAVLALALCLAGCSQQAPPRVAVGPEVRASLVAVFALGISNAEINHFLEQALFVGPAIGQHSHRPGIRSILKVSIQHHAGYAVTFFPGAALEQRTQVRASMVASGVVLRVFDDVAPADIRPEQLMSSGARSVQHIEARRITTPCSGPGPRLSG